MAKVVPLADRVVLKPVAAEEKTASGIILPESAKEKPEQGKVVAVGKEVKEVKEEIQQVRGRLENRIDQVELGFSEKLTQFKSDILDGVDKVYGELVALREESTIHQGQHDRTGETLEDHEKRIQSLETHPKI